VGLSHPPLLEVVPASGVGEETRSGRRGQAPGGRWAGCTSGWAANALTWAPAIKLLTTKAAWTRSYLRTRLLFPSA